MALGPIGDIATLADVLGVSEQAAAQLVLQPSVTETIAAAETAQTPVVLSPAVAETAGASEAVSAPVQLAPSIVDSAAAVETASAGVDLVPSVTETIGVTVTESASAPVVLSPSAVETATATETASPPVQLVPSVTETASSSVPNSGLARYEFEQDVTDSWNNNDLADNTSAGYRTGEVGTYAKDFDGADDYLTAPFSFGPGDDFSLVGWIYFDAFNEFNPPVAQRDSFSTMDWILYYDSTSGSSAGDGWKLGVGENLAWNPNTNVLQSTGTYTHIGLTKGGDTWSFYKSGTQEWTDTNSQSWTESDSLYFMAWGGGSTNNADGGLDHMDWFTKELTATEVNNHFNTGSISG